MIPDPPAAATIMKRTLPIALAILVGAALIGVGWTHPDWLSAWARLGARPSQGDGDETGDGHPPGPEGHHAHREEEHAGGAGGHAGAVKLTPEAIRRYGVRVEPARKHLLVPTFAAPARVSYNAEAMAHVGTPITGRVAEIRVRVGDHVKQGDRLLVLQSSELGADQSDYLQKQGAARTAEPAVDIARSAYGRAKDLYEQTRGVALTEVQKREAELRAAQAALQAAQAAATAAESKLRQLGMSPEELEALARTGKVDPRFTVEAPIAGQVIEREATLGELVGPEREALLILADLSVLWVLADVPESRIGDVAVGAKARVRVRSEGADDGFEGTVSFLAPALDAATRTVPVRIEVTDERTALRPGLFARAEITVTRPDAAPDPVLAVPESAIQTVAGTTAVFVPVAAAEDTFAARPIVAGKAVGRMVPVLAGLQEAEPLVTAGSFILKAELGKAGARHDH
jgi:membrane fusion protein, heavy metal efflux system